MFVEQSTGEILFKVDVGNLQIQDNIIRIFNRDNYNKFHEQREKDRGKNIMAEMGKDNGAKEGEKGFERPVTTMDVIEDEVEMEPLME